MQMISRFLPTVIEYARRKKMLTPNAPLPAKMPKGERNPGIVGQACCNRTSKMATPRKPSRLGIRPVSIDREVSLEGGVLCEGEFTVFKTANPSCPNRTKSSPAGISKCLQVRKH